MPDARVESLARFLYLRHDQQYDHKYVPWERLTEGDEYIRDRQTAGRYRRDARAILRHLTRPTSPGGSDA